MGGLVDLFQEKAFALLFVVLMAVPALPLPTGGATHAFEIVVVLGAAQLLAGRRTIWLPQRWRALAVAGPAGPRRSIERLIGLIARLERFSKPRLPFLFGHRLSDAVFALLVIAGAAGAFLAVPFTGLDTLPALGVVLVSLGFLLEDFLVVAAGIVAGATGIVLEIALGKAAIEGTGVIF